ncbi:Protein CBG26173 [Caenorhabditis briggsae]|uniref:Uncharacterized protein n=2 Tax=Caenorhabditis briggsae TaxID=6238 RepID=A0AAE9J7X5_CAEBR|nr:Protein CBG26173 [Caenorhabditis briggsae]ULU07866.1 hypothetical protein L3Y34_019120 [Caenorhabditis briggsae]UMM19799.1 hypothetical protein L5515_015249 [Caenorhabditis briggsae]CAS00689.1 Protein CBG26173 [Caenorhabditis briggsae]
MKFFNIFVLLSLVAFSQGTVYWMKYMDLVQVQANLILFVHSHYDTALLRELLSSGNNIDRYLARHPKKVMFAQVQSAQGLMGKVITGIVLVHDEGKSYHAKLHMIPSVSSPTGYKIDKAIVCKDEECQEEYED